MNYRLAPAVALRGSSKNGRADPAFPRTRAAGFRGPIVGSTGRNAMKVMTLAVAGMLVAGG